MRQTTNMTASVTHLPGYQYYVDELGFYRHSGADGHQNANSNLHPVQTQLHNNNDNDSNNRQQFVPQRGTNFGRAYSTKSQPTMRYHSSTNHRQSQAPATVLQQTRAPPTDHLNGESAFKSIRRELGISHYDRTLNYKTWKAGWDEFIRSKLVNREAVILNNELKARIRSGIPHDYRCKIWTALIRMRTKSFRTPKQITQWLPPVSSKVEHTESILQDGVKLGSRSSYGAGSVTDEGSRESSISESLRDGKGQQRPQPQQEQQRQATAGAGIYEHLLSRYVLRAEVPDYNRQSGIDSSDGGFMAPEVHGHHESELICSGSPQRNSFLASCKTGNQVVDKCFRQIELDLLRTLPNNRHFEDANSRGVKRVRRVLRAYAAYNPSVGYCQGMNRLAAMALLVLPEEEAFWCLVGIVQCIMPRDYYLKPWLAQVDCSVLDELIERKLPKLHRHMARYDIQLTLFTWFFTLFVDGFRPELVLRIWDCLLLEGDKVLFRFALAILALAERDLLALKDFASMNVYLSRFVSTRRLDIEQLFEVAFGRLNPFSSNWIRARREHHRKRLQQLMGDQ